MPEIDIKGVRLVVSAADLADARYMRFLHGLDRRQLLRRRLRRHKPSPRPQAEPEVPSRRPMAA